MNKIYLSIIVPCFNEKKTILKVINQIKRFDNGLSDSLQSEFDNLIDRIVE